MNYQKLTQDQETLLAEEGHQIAFLREPVWSRFPNSEKSNAEQVKLMNQWVKKEPFRRCVIIQRSLWSAYSQQKKQTSGRARQKFQDPKCLQFILTLQDRRPMILQEQVFMYKIYLKNAYFSVAVGKPRRNRKNYLHYVWESNLCEFLCLFFGLSPASFCFSTK